MREFDKKCSKCRNYNGNILICESCAHYKPKQTVFQRITASPEVLAPLLVRTNAHEFTGIFYTSVIVCGSWNDEAEAISATLEELNKVSK